MEPWIEYDFEERRNSPIWWYNKASDLRASARVIWAAINHGEDNNETLPDLGLGAGFSIDVACWPVYKMLIGMSFEALLKSGFVSQKTEVEYTHKLNVLAESLNLQLTNIEYETISYLSEYIIWYGKYPVPKTIKLYEGFLKRQHSLNEKSCGVSLDPKDILHWEQINTLWLKVFKAIDKKYGIFSN
ncbi:MAG: hypothetical protein N4A72_22690 [Bacteroidales bacterium]|jgi:sulfur relay (sulfurtransferase) DsrC/TusE family protein|nr:hypothetical protein [Bacteroidales bacterium]